MTSAASARLFPIARLVVIALVTMLLALFLYSAVLFPTFATTHADFFLGPPWTAAAVRLALAELGLSLRAYLWIQLLSDVLTAAPYLTISALLLSRRATGWFGLYVALLFAVFGIGTSYMTGFVMLAHPSLEILVMVLGWLAWGAFLPLGYVFPDGRFVPRWTRWIVLGWALVLAITFVVVPPFESPWWFVLAALTTLLGAVASLIYRYARRADAVQRQQTKWIIWAIMLFSVSFTMVSLINISLPVGSEMTERGLLYQLFNRISGVLIGGVIPLAVGIAILRYRLWDVDLLINRTLVYGALTATLALVYLGSVVLLQRLMTPLIGQDFPLAIVASTLAIAALFQPLRRRIQNTIDRRFYRRKYDSQRVLESFAGRLRQETDLDAMTHDMLGVIHDTLQPTHASLWLREPKRSAEGRAE
jgi:hypothetical protein